MKYVTEKIFAVRWAGGDKTHVSTISIGRYVSIVWRTQNDVAFKVVDPSSGDTVFEATRHAFDNGTISEEEYGKRLTV